MISVPCVVVIVTLVMRILVFGGSSVVSGRAGPDAVLVVRCCFGRLPSATSSKTPLFVGDGRACLLWQLVGAVAIGELASACVDAGAFGDGVSIIARGGSCGAVVSGVCVSVVAVGLLGGL